MYTLEMLCNGLVRVDCRNSGLVALYKTDGATHSGSLREITKYVIRAFVAPGKTIVCFDARSNTFAK